MGTSCGILKGMAQPQPERNKTDTPPEVQRVHYEICRTLSDGRRLELAFDMCDTGRLLAIAGLRMRHPDASEDQLQRLWARQHLGPELFERVYGGSQRG